MQLTALVTSLALGGCSFVMTDRPKAPPADPDCTRSYGAVGLDIVGALTWPFVAGFGYIIARADSGDLDDSDAGTVGVIVAGTFIAELVAAGVGSRASATVATRIARMAYPFYPQQQPYYPQPYPQPQPAPPAPPPTGGLGQVGDSCNIERLRDRPDVSGKPVPVADAVGSVYEHAHISRA
jgi:hypothetical protein